MEKGVLYIIPSAISEEVNDSLALRTIEVVHQTKHFVVERARTARRFIKSCGPPYQISELEIFEIEAKDGEKLDFKEIEAILNSGTNVGLLSEAGCPAIADPGSDLVWFLQRKEIVIVPLVGPSSIFLAIMASGLNGQQFQFNGYLPIDKDDLKKAILRYQDNAIKNKATQIFIETPYRNDRLLSFLLKFLEPGIRICIASDLTGDKESVRTKSVKEWKQNLPTIGKVPTVFLFNK